jgi:hypothetical protein
MIMGMGFNWAPPSVLVDLMGVKNTVKMLERCGLGIPALLQNADPSQQFFTQNISPGKFFVAK